MSKSRGERKTPSGNQNVQIVAQNAVIPGKFMDSDWNELVENETGEEFIFDIVVGIAELACNKIYEKTINQRVQPYAVLSARKLFLELLEWKFLECDRGEENTEKDFWCEDDEPIPCVTDSWAQGAVPVVMLNTTTESVAEDTIMKTVIIDDKIADEVMMSGPITTIDVKKSSSYKESKVTANVENVVHPDTVSRDIERKSLSPSPIFEPQPPVENKINNGKSNRHKKIFKPHGGSVPAFQPVSLTSVIEDRPERGSVHPIEKTACMYSSDSLLRMQRGRPPGVKEAIYDEKGNVLRVQKLKISKLPNHRVPTKYKILDTKENLDQKSVMTSKLRQNFMRSTVNKKNNIVKNPTALLRKLNTQNPDVLNGLRTPLPPTMVDAIEVAEGVTIREGGLSKQGPRKNKTQQHSTEEDACLHPLASSSTRILNANDIVADSTPTVKPFTTSQPLPAIFS